MSRILRYDIQSIEDCEQEEPAKNRPVIVQIVQEVRTRRIKITRCVVRQTRYSQISNNRTTLIKVPQLTIMAKKVLYEFLIALSLS